MAKPLRGELEAELAGQKYTLRLGIGELEEIESRTGLGTLEVLRSFGTNAKIGTAVAVLSQAMTENGKKIGEARVRRLVEKAGFREAITACVDILRAVLLDQSEGNAEAVADEETTTAA